MIQKLRLHPAPVQPNLRDGSAQPSLKFPAGLMSSIKRGGGAKGRLPRPLSITGHADLVRQVEDTLDHMQQRLNDVKDQVENYRFPTERFTESDRPRAA